MESDCKMIQNAQTGHSEVSCLVDSPVPSCLAVQKHFPNAPVVNIEDASLVNITTDSVQIIGYLNKVNDCAIEGRKDYEPLNGCLTKENNKNIEDGKQCEESEKIGPKIVRDSGYNGTATFRGKNRDTTRNILQGLQEFDGQLSDASCGCEDEKVKNVGSKGKNDEFCQELVELDESGDHKVLRVGDLTECERRDDEIACAAKEKTVGNVTASFDEESSCTNAEVHSTNNSKSVKYRREGKREYEMNNKRNDFSDAINGYFKQLVDDKVDERREEDQENRVGKCGQHKFHSFVQGENGNVIIINIENAGLYVAGNDNRFYLPGGGPYVEPNGSLRLVFNRDDVLQSVIKSDPRLFPNALKRDGSCATRRYDKIMNQMRHFQDNGLSEKMRVYSKKLQERFESSGEVDLKVVVKIQFVVFCIYQKDLKRAKIELDEAMKLAEQAENRQFLIGRCLVFCANIAMYEKQYEKALEYLGQANSVLALFVSGEDKAMIWYLYGCVYMNMAASMSEPSGELERKAIECFETEVLHGKEDPDPSVIAKKLQFSVLKQINIYLRTYASHHCHEYSVSKESTTKAKELLDAFEHDLWSEASPAAQVHFAAMRADYFYRMGQPLRALDIIQTGGAKRARKIGHLPLNEMVDSRIELFKELIMVNESKVMVLEDVSDEAIDSILDEED